MNDIPNTLSLYSTVKNFQKYVKFFAAFPVAQNGLEIGVWSGVWRLEFGVWRLEIGVWSLGFGGLANFATRSKL